MIQIFLIYQLSGNENVVKFLEDKYCAISVITEIEILAKPSLTIAEEKSISQIFSKMDVINISKEIKKECIRLKKLRPKIKLPDALIAATSNILEIPLITADKQLLGWEEIETMNILI